MHVTPSAPSLSFRLSYLELNTSHDAHQDVFKTLLTQSSGTLQALSLRHLGLSPPAASFVIETLSRTAFPQLLHLIIRDGYGTAYSQLLPLLPALRELTLYLNDHFGRPNPEIFTTIASACSPTLSVLNVGEQGESGPRMSFPALCESFASPGFRNLQNLYLPEWFRGGPIRLWWFPAREEDTAKEAVAVEEWGGFQERCAARPIRFVFLETRYRGW